MPRPAPAAARSDAVGRLRDRGLRVTGPRAAVLAALAGSPHLDADQVRRRVADTLGSVSVQTVYDVLATLTDAGLVRRIEPAGSAALYELRVGDNHHHVVCRSCGRIEDVSCATGRAPCLVPSPDPAASGFVVDEAEVTWWGLCPTCQQNP